MSRSPSLRSTARPDSGSAASSDRAGGPASSDRAGGPASSDTDLAHLAGQGDATAFDELYRRHVDSAYRVARAVTRNTHDAADAVSEAFTKVFTSLSKSSGFSTGFRPYLLAATRNASIDILRRKGRALPSEPETFERPDNRAGPAAALVAGADSAMVITALETLPERWRTILWLTEVEGLNPRDAAPVMGLTANGASQLAVRARAGLREAYLQAHLRSEVGAACTEAVPLLGAYVAGALSARDLSKVDQHLAACDSCRAPGSRTRGRERPPPPGDRAPADCFGWCRGWPGRIARTVGRHPGRRGFADFGRPERPGAVPDPPPAEAPSLRVGGPIRSRDHGHRGCRGAQEQGRHHRQPALAGRRIAQPSPAPG